MVRDGIGSHGSVWGTAFSRCSAASGVVMVGDCSALQGWRVCRGARLAYDAPGRHARTAENKQQLSALCWLIRSSTASRLVPAQEGDAHAAAGLPPPAGLCARSPLPELAACGQHHLLEPAVSPPLSGMRPSHTNALLSRTPLPGDNYEEFWWEKVHLVGKRGVKTEEEKKGTPDAQTSYCRDRPLTQD